MSKIETLQIQKRFNDADQMGHVNNAVIMEYFDLGKEHFFATRGLSPEDGDFTVMVVHYETDFVSQIRFHDEVEVSTEVERFGTKSFTLLQRITECRTGRICTVCHTVMAGYRRSTGTSAVIPDEVKQRLMD